MISVEEFNKENQDLLTKGLKKKLILKITQAVIKVRIVLKKKIYNQLREKIKMREIRVKIDQEKERCQRLLLLDYYVNERIFKITL
jgi:hypothetical protein